MMNLKVIFKKSLIMIVFTCLLSFNFLRPNILAAKELIDQPANTKIAGLLTNIKNRNANITGGVYKQETNGNTALDYVADLILVMFSLFGIIFVALFIYAGVTWMTARGVAAKVATAQSVMTTALVGLLITISSYAVWRFVFFRILEPSGYSNGAQEDNFDDFNSGNNNEGSDSEGGEVEIEDDGGDNNDNDNNNDNNDDDDGEPVNDTSFPVT